MQKRVRVIEEMSEQSSNWEAKCKLLTAEVERLTEESEGYRESMELYKKKYVELSGLTDQVNNTMAAYVVMCA